MSQLQVTGEAKIRDIQGPVVANDGVVTALDGAASQYVRGDGTLADFPTSTGGGSSVSYYLNSSVSQGTIGGVAYRELSKTPIIGTGTDISISSNGYVANYLTDANDPDLLEVPGGNFNCEFYFSVNNNTGNPFTYAELYKYDGTTFTLLGSSVGVPEYITQGTTIAPYYFAIPVATAALALTDRLAIRIYVNVDGRTVTLHTENSHLCQVVTTFSKGMVSLNNLTDQSQYLTTGTSGTNFNIVSSGDTHTFNLPVASAANTGKLSSTDWSTFNGKVPYIGATANVDLGVYSLFSASVSANFLYANGASPVGGYISLKQGDATIINIEDYNNIYANGTKYVLIANAGTTNYKLASFDLASLTNNTARTFTLPDLSGTLALLEGTQTFSGEKVFSNNALFNSVLSVNYGAWLQKGVPLATYSSAFTTLYSEVGAINAVFRDNTNQAKLQFQAASNYTYTFPAASGTIALTSDLSAYLPLAGGTLTGALGINSTSLTGYSFRNSRNLTGASTTYANYADGQIQTDATGLSHYFYSEANVIAATTATGIYHFKATQGTFGAGSSLSVQAGLVIDVSLSGAATNVGIISNINAAESNWNLYIGGTAKNWIASSLGIGAGLSSPTATLDVNGTFKVSGAATFSSSVTAGGAISSDLTDGGAILTKTAGASVGLFTNTFQIQGSGSKTDLNAYIYGANPFGIWTNGSQKLIVTSAGNVGIGTNNPVANLDVSSVNSTAFFRVGSTSSGTAGSIDMYASGTGGFQAGTVGFNTANNVPLLFNIGGTEKVRITSSGNVGIGTSSPFELLTINNGTQANSFGLQINNNVNNTSGIGFAQYGSNATYTYIKADGRSTGFMTFSTNDTERMRITSTGNVGIGTSSPVTNLDINSAISGAYTSSSSQAPLRVFNVTNAGGINSSVISFQCSTDNSASNPVARIGVVGESAGSNNGSMIMMTRDGGGVTERMRITSGGNVLINKTSLSAASFSANGTLQVNNEIVSTGSGGGLFWENRSGGVTSNSNWYGWYTLGGTIYLYNGAGNIAQINTSSGTYTALSDINRKKDFEESTIGLNAILGLKPTLYRMKTDDENSQKQLGFIAQEVKEFIPQAYIQTKGEKEDFIGLDDRPIIAALVKAIQELNEKIKQLENK